MLPFPLFSPFWVCCVIILIFLFWQGKTPKIENIFVIAFLVCSVVMLCGSIWGIFAFPEKTTIWWWAVLSIITSLLSIVVSVIFIIRDRTSIIMGCWWVIMVIINIIFYFILFALMLYILIYV